MADYNSNYTGQEIDEAVGKTQTLEPYILELQLTAYPDVVLAVPDGDESDVYDVISQGSSSSRDYWVRITVNGGTFAFLPAHIDVEGTSYAIVATAKNSLVTALMPGYIGDAKIVLANENYDVPWTATFVPDVFVVTLTPTAQDFSGTMDKTPEEIDTAYRAGRRIRFRVIGMNAEVDATQYAGNTTPPEYYQPVANVIYNGMLVQIMTSRLDQTYLTTIYTLTPMT